MQLKDINLKPGKLVVVTGDVHVYKNHLEQVNEQLSRDPHSLPKLEIIRNRSSIFEFDISDFELTEYNPHPFISAPIAV